MQAHDFFLSLLIILLTARVFAELATRLKSPAVIGLMSVVIKRFDANSEIPGLIPTTIVSLGGRAESSATRSTPAWSSSPP